MNQRKFIIAAVLLIPGIAGLFLLPGLSENKNKDTLVRLNASASFDGTRITVSNHDTVDYLNAELTLNGYYKIVNMNLTAGETYVLWPVEFTHVNGRSMPAKQKPRQFAIWCRLADESNGFNSIGFNTE
jgi:hypothetical protein